MQRPKFIPTTSMEVNETYEGVSIEEKIRMKLDGVATEGADIDDSIPIIYTDKSAGVMAETDIRTDRFEVARVAMEKMQYAEAQKAAKRAKTQEPPEEESADVSNAGGLS